MNEYIILQLGIDIVLFVLIIAFIVKEGKKSAPKAGIPDAEELRALIKEFRDAVSESERASKALDEQLKTRMELLAAQKERPSAGGEGVEKENGTSQSAAGAGSTEERRRNARLLYRKGVPKDEISKRLSMPLPEVELIIKMLDSTAGG